MALKRFILPLLALLACTLSARAEVLYPLGLRVGLEPPAGIELSKRFPGFEDVDRNARISVLDLPSGAYQQLETATFTSSQVGLTDVKRESFPFASGIGFLVTAQSEQNGIKLRKWFFVARAVAGPELDLATLVTVEVPEAAASIYTDALVRKALSTITFRPAPMDELVRLLPFRLNNLANFRIMQVIPGGAILTDGPSDQNSAQPYMIVGIVQGAATDTADRARVSRDLLNSAPMRDLNITSAEPMRISGTPGFEIRATATAPDGSKVSLVQWVRFGGGGYMRIVGVSRTEAWDQLFPRFRAVRDGIDSNN